MVLELVSGFAPLNLFYTFIFFLYFYLVCSLLYYSLSMSEPNFTASLSTITDGNGFLIATLETQS
jgi:hypothetical protein